MLALRRARQSFSEYHHELHELFDAGDTVVAAVSFHATARQRSKRVVIQKEEAHVWTFRDGKIVRFENGPQSEGGPRSRRAVGVGPQPCSRP